MSRYLPWLRQYLEENPDFIRPARYRTEAIAMLESGDLEDLCILEAQKPPDLGHRIAPLTRITSAMSGLTPCWPISAAWAGRAERILLILAGRTPVAKDILKPSCHFWPSMLKSAGLPCTAISTCAWLLAFQRLQDVQVPGQCGRSPRDRAKLALTPFAIFYCAKCILARTPVLMSAA